MNELKRKLKANIKSIAALLRLIFWRLSPARKGEAPIAFVFHVSKWKREYIASCLEGPVRFVPFHYNFKVLRHELDKYRNKVFYIWGSNEEGVLMDYANQHGIPVCRMEDGFIRSVGLGALHHLPYSICIDRKGIYYDATTPSELEDILNTYDFENDPALVERSKENIKRLRELGISKYNHVEKKPIDHIYGPKTKKRILVIGQVEEDASIKKGSRIKWTNNDIVRAAAQEQPDAEIIYKPHPDVLSGKRKELSNPEKVMHLAKVIEEPLSLIDALETIDHVYTITSLSGFEALLRGIPVTTFGAPFYSGWGLTDDRQEEKRRKRNLTIEQLFAGAYILYPMYRDPYTHEVITVEETIARISSSLKK